MEQLFITYPQGDPSFTVTNYTQPHSEYTAKHTHNFFEFYIQLEGKIHNIYNETEKILVPGNIVLMGPQGFHTVDAVPNETHLHRDVYVSINKMYQICQLLSPTLYSKISTTSNVPITFEINPQKLNLLEKKLELFDTPSASTDYGAFHTCIVYELLSLYIEYQILQPARYSKPIQNLLQLLTQPEYFTLSTEDVAKKLHYSRTYLSDEFRKCTGKKLIDYINESRINHALILLMQKDLSVADIATRLGYDSQNSFTRNFRNLLNITPAAWRKSHADDKPQKEKATSLFDDSDVYPD